MIVFSHSRLVDTAKLFIVNNELKLNGEKIVKKMLETFRHMVEFSCNVPMHDKVVF
jgi:hypothetical protein